MRPVSLAAGLLPSSRVGFGTSALHHLKTRRSRAALLAHCYERGIRHFDSAPLYGHQLAERELGCFIRERRAQLVIATKFGIEPHPWMARSPAIMYAGLSARSLIARFGRRRTRDWRKDFDPKLMLRSLERSLRNLQTDHVDLFFTHEATLAARGFSEALIGELERIKSAGKARFVGLSGNAGDCIAIALRYPGISDVLQIDVSTEARSVERAEHAGLEPGVTCGHFRSALKGAAVGARSAIIREQVASAVRQNPRGVILFSARSSGRVDEILRLVEQTDEAAA